MEFFVHENFFFKLIILLWQCSFAISVDPLPFNVMPEEYTVEIYTNPYRDENGSLFQGTVRIQVACAEITTTIIMDAVNLTIDNQNTRIWNLESPGNRIGVTDQSHLEGKFIINLDEALIPEVTYVIELKYSSPGGPVGYIVDLALSESYVQTDKYAARHIFPCFDQIDLKASFKIRLKHEKRLNGLSMTKLESRLTSEYDGYVTDIFESLLYPMSTYSVMLALTSSNCYLSEAGRHYTSSLIDIGYCIDDSNQHLMLEYICKKIANILDFLSNFLEMLYPLNKFDILIQSAGPDDFSEGYGLVLTRSSYLTSVIDQLDRDLSFRYEGIKRLCYVLSHHWFGHIVTMNWEESWIHNGLNIYILWQWAAAEQHEPVENGPYPNYKWDIISSFLRIMKKEETGDWILMSTENSNWDSEPGSDNIQLKAAHLLRMISLNLGTSRFKGVIQQYLKTYEFRNTNMQHVWNSFTATVVNDSPRIFNNSFTVEDVMKNWINQNGHPLILVERDYRSGQLILKQQRYTILVDSGTESSQASEICWTIPLSYLTKNGDRESFWFFCDDEGSTNEMHLPVERVNKNHWVLINIELSVLCRVQYDADSWKLIQKLFLNDLEQYEITELNRVRIISDMFTLAKDRKLSYVIVLKTVMYLHQERSYGVWKVATDELHEIRSRLLASAMNHHKGFKKYMQRLLEPVFLKIRWHTQNYQFQQDNPSELNLSVLIMEQACTYGVKSCLSLGSMIINNHSELTDNENSRIPYSINKAIHCQEVKRNNKHRKKLWNMYRETDISNEIKELILMALGCTRDITYLTRYVQTKYMNLDRLWGDFDQRARYLQWSLDPQIVAHNDRLHIFKSVSLNVKGYNELRKLFQNNYASLIHQPSEGTSTGHDVSIIPYWQIILDATHHQRDLNKLKIFAQKNNVDLQSEWMRKSIANAQRNINWRKRNNNSLETIISTLVSDDGS